MASFPTYTQHPISCNIPEPSDEDRVRLALSLQEHGYQPHSEIILYEGQILDGWTRYNECKKQNITPQFAEYAGNDPIGFAFDKNVSRRHLTLVQILHSCQGMRPLMEAEAAERKNLGVNLHRRKNTGETPKTSAERVNEQIARISRTSPSTVANYQAVQKNGSAELKKAVDSEEVSISDAAAIARTTDKQAQTAAVATVRSGKAKTLRKAVAPSKNGRPKFDDKKIDAAIGNLAKLFDARGHAYGKCKEQEDCHTKLDAVVNAFTRWKNKS